MKNASASTKKMDTGLEMRFIDSHRFTSGSLETLAKNLTTDEKIVAVKKCLCERYDIMIRKGVYPYDYMDGSAKIEETQLPPKEEFFSGLYGEHISVENYAHAQHVFKKCRTMWDYHNLCLKSNAVILEDILYQSPAGAPLRPRHAADV